MAEGLHHAVARRTARARTDLVDADDLRALRACHHPHPVAADRGRRCVGDLASRGRHRPAAVHRRVRSCPPGGVPGGFRHDRHRDHRARVRALAAGGAGAPGRHHPAAHGAGDRHAGDGAEIHRDRTSARWRPTSSWRLPPPSSRSASSTGWCATRTGAATGRKASDPTGRRRGAQPRASNTASAAAPGASRSARWPAPGSRRTTLLPAMPAAKRSA